MLVRILVRILIISIYIGNRFYPLQQNRDVLKKLNHRPRTIQGLADQGVYLYSANTPSQSYKFNLYEDKQVLSYEA